MSEFEIMPIGSRIFVELIAATSDIEARAQAAGIAVVLDEASLPKPTEGVVVAIGTDPLIQEVCRIDDVVTFSKYAGMDQIVEGKTYRSLELRELIAVIRKKQEPSSSQPPPSPQL